MIPAVLPEYLHFPLMDRGKCSGCCTQKAIETHLIVNSDCKKTHTMSVLYLKRHSSVWKLNHPPSFSDDLLLHNFNIKCPFMKVEFAGVQLIVNTVGINDEVNVESAPDPLMEGIYLKDFKFIIRE